MPVYLLHGFKWPRPLIRIHIILQNLDDAAAEWLVSPGTTQCLLENFETLYPDQMKHLPNLKFIEQFDPEDESSTNNGPSQPFAYVADVCVEVKLGINIDEFRGKGVTGDQWQALMELRDKIAPEERPGWFVVVCGDEERWAPPTINTLNHSVRASENGVVHSAEPDTETAAPKSTSAAASPANPSVLDNGLVLSDKRKSNPKVEESRGFRKFIGGFSRRKSHANLPTRTNKEDPLPQAPASSSSTATETAPQLPPVSSIPRLPPCPSVITNDNLVAEVNGNARAISAFPLNEPLVELSTLPPTRAGEESSRSRSISPIEEVPSTPGTEYSDAEPGTGTRSDTSTPMALQKRISEVPRFKPTLSNPIPPEFRRAQSVVVRRPVAARASLPPLKTHKSDETLPDHANDDDLSAPAPSVLPKREGKRALQKAPADPPAGRHSLFPKIDSSRPPMTQIEVVSNEEDDGECVVITMQPRTSTPVRNKSHRRSQHGSRSDKVLSHHSRIRSNASPVKDDGSPGPSRPRGSRSTGLSSPPRRHSDAVENSDKPAFGQRISQFDIIANQIENALNEMR
ncbi:hypothetical protein CKM354_001162600 [Cercospora kikuchii]|uniref:Uncharacterized protein n=1 Tax=Cercospora kikuchii TaxID=84275 RepID=A0A9P3FKE7_9PEZI|nr:uncharacterized protein CKM354_001162600 [Cercospora kikuchii]GIZ48572.1 hypothetical protein CKM354_001162600 [Cercospora kikuchii]